MIVHAADIQDREGAKLVLGRLLEGGFTRLKLIWADGAYGGEHFVEWVKRSFGWVLEIVKRPKDQKGFVVLPHRWVVERTLGWLGRYRRLQRCSQRLILNIVPAVLKPTHSVFGRDRTQRLGYRLYQRLTRARLHLAHDGLDLRERFLYRV